MKRNLIFNTPIELGLRAMLILNEIYPESISLDRIIYLDYLTIYMEDTELGIESLHPKYAMSSIEILSRREIMKESLMYMVNKGLLLIEYNENGIEYSANINTRWFLEGLIDDIYTSELIKRIHAISREFIKYSDNDLKKIIEEKNKGDEREFDNFFPYTERSI